jgi:enoyl-CoA hydratase/carnithine racemase
MKLEREGDVCILELPAGWQFTADTLTEAGALLDQVDAPLVTLAPGKSWVLGLDLAWMGEHPDRAAENVRLMHELFARVLTLPVPTVAAVSGHAFAGGAMLALAHDFRIMRADRGFFCLPEVDGNLPFTPGLTRLITGRLAPQVAVEAMTTGRRYGGEEAERRGIVDRAVAEDEVVPAARELAASLAGKDRTTLAQIKAELHRDAVATLRDWPANEAALSSVFALFA